MVKHVTNIGGHCHVTNIGGHVAWWELCGRFLGFFGGAGTDFIPRSGICLNLRTAEIPTRAYDLISV